MIGYHIPIENSVSQKDSCIICLIYDENLTNYSYIFGCHCSRNLFHKACWEEYNKNYTICPLCRKQRNHILVQPISNLPESPLVAQNPNVNIIVTNMNNSIFMFVNFGFWVITLIILIIGLQNTNTKDELFIFGCLNIIWSTYQIFLAIIDFAYKRILCIYKYFYENNKIAFFFMVILTLFNEAIISLWPVIDVTQKKMEADMYLTFGFVIVLIRFGLSVLYISCTGCCIGLSRIT